MQSRSSVSTIFSRLDPFLTMGITISVVLAVVLVLLGQDTVDSLVAGLLATIITLLVDIVARQRESERRILQAISLGEVVSADTELHRWLSDIAGDYTLVSKGSFPLFVERGRDALVDCRLVLSGLVDGNMAVPPASKYAYGRKGVASAEKCVKAVDYEAIPSWRTEHLKDVVEANAETIKRGVRIERVFILAKESLQSATDVLDAHKQAGVKVYVVAPGELPSTQFLESFLIIDDKVVVYFYYTRDVKQFTGERISVEPHEVGAALSRFETLLRRAKLYTGIEE